MPGDLVEIRVVVEEEKPVVEGTLPNAPVST